MRACKMTNHDITISLYFLCFINFIALCIMFKSQIQAFFKGVFKLFYYLNIIEKLSEIGIEEYKQLSYAERKAIKENETKASRYFSKVALTYLENHYLHMKTAKRLDLVSKAENDFLHAIKYIY